MVNVFKNIKYWQMIVFQVIVVIGVILLFRTIPDKKVASVFASLLFIILSGSLSYIEFQKPKPWINPLFLSALFFLVVIALPLPIFRFLNWDKDFSEIKIWGLDGPVFHRISNYFFILMLVATVWNVFLNKNPNKKS